MATIDIEESLRELRRAMDALWKVREHISDAQWRTIQDFMLNIERHTEERVRTGVGRTLAEVSGAYRFDALTPVGRMFVSPETKP